MMGIVGSILCFVTKGLKVMKALEQKNVQKIIYVLMFLTAVGITVTGILTKIPVIKILPLYVSIIIMMLQTRVSRVAYLLGAMNSLLYGFVDFSYGLYASVAYDILFSSFIQLFTFFYWKKRAYGRQSVQLKKMSAKQRILCLVGFAAVYAALFAVLSMLDSSYRAFDTLQSLLGIAVTFLTAFAFVEYGPLQFISGIGSIVLNVVMLRDHPERMPYVIFFSYSLICIGFALIRLRGLWNEQKVQREANLSTAPDTEKE